MSIEFCDLTLKPEYPEVVRAVAIAQLHYDTKAKRLYFDRPPGSDWVVSFWIREGACQIDLTAILKENGLAFIAGYCVHGECCPTVEKLKHAILESEAFARLREEVIHELFQVMVQDPHLADPLPPGRGIASWEEEKEL
jgi:hypothetical protein